MMELRRLAKYLECYEECFAQILAQKVNSDMLSEQKHLEKTLAKTIARNATLTDLLAKIYEDNISGKLSDEMFMQLSRKYEKEQYDNKAKIKEYSERLSKIDEMKQNKADFIKSIRKFMEMQTLTAPLLRELIDHIDVYEKEGTSKTYTQRIVIYYRFIGTLKLPEEIEQESYIADTRQGVTVEYLSA